jgi:hypothetical protein
MIDFKLAIYPHPSGKNDVFPLSIRDFRYGACGKFSPARGRER